MPATHALSLTLHIDRLAKGTIRVISENGK